MEDELIFHPLQSGTALPRHWQDKAIDSRPLRVRTQILNNLSLESVPAPAECRSELLYSDSWAGSTSSERIVTTRAAAAARKRAAVKTIMMNMRVIRLNVSTSFFTPFAIAFAVYPPFQASITQ